MNRPDRLLTRLLPALRDLRRRALDFEREHGAELALVPARGQPSARNFLHYLSVRQHDIRSLQQDLASMGLTSLGIMESHACASLDAVIAVLEQLAQVPAEEEHPATAGRFPQRQAAAARPRTRTARAAAARSHGADHGDDAGRGRAQPAVDRRPAACRHGRDAHQLRARRRRRLARDGRAPARGRAPRRPPLSRAGGSRRPEAAHRHRSHRSAALHASSPCATRSARCVEPGRAWLVGPAEGGAVPAGAVRVPVPEGFVERLQPGDSLALQDRRGRRSWTAGARAQRRWLAGRHRPDDLPGRRRGVHLAAWTARSWGVARSAICRRSSSRSACNATIAWC